MNLLMEENMKDKKLMGIDKGMELFIMLKVEYIQENGI
jgi:hypothetical protein